MIFTKKIIEIYKSMAFTRCDDTGNVFYFTAKDFPGLHCEPYTFTARAGHILQGYVYNYDNPIPGSIVVFDHGFGGGHTAYMKEIEMLCRHGYMVFAYDHTGCMESGGENTNGMAQSLCDLDDCIAAIKADEKFAGLDISVMGHSWGGFSTLNITAIHPEISHVVVMSGFVSVELLVDSYFKGIMKGYRKDVMALETRSNPLHVNYNGADTLGKTDAKVLLIYSDNDTLCSKEVHFDYLKERLSGKDNIRFMLVEGKGHNPNYTNDAVAYKDAFFADMTKKVKKKQLETPEQKATFIASYDWEMMTAQDEEVWGEVFKVLEA